MFRKIFIVAFLALPVAGICKQQKKKPAAAPRQVTEVTDYKAIGSPMPAIRAVTLNNQVITNKELSNGANTLLMLFNPTCEHCEDMTFLLEKNIHLFNKSKALLIATASMMPYIEYFQNNTKVNKYPLLQVGVDSAKAIDVLFNYTALPQINIYNPEHKLIKVFNGDTPIDSLKLYIE